MCPNGPAQGGIPFCQKGNCAWWAESGVQHVRDANPSPAVRRMASLSTPFQPTLGPSDTLDELRSRFATFRTLLDRNYEALRIIGDMEEKAQGEYIFDLAYIRHGLEEVRGAVGEIIDLLIELGGERYGALRSRQVEIDRRIASIFPWTHPEQHGPLILPFTSIDRYHAATVGSKNAQLGEMARLGLHVPRGFAITVYAYRRFLAAAGLQDEIDRDLKDLDILDQEALAAASRAIQEKILAAPLPPELAEAILEAHERTIGSHSQ